LFNQGLISKKVLSLWLNNNETQTNGGQLFFGGSNSNYYTGDFSYVNVSRKGFWQFKMSGYIYKHLHINA
jgi:cathepsin D